MHERSSERLGNNRSKETAKRMALRVNQQVFNIEKQVDKARKKRSAIRE